MAHVLLTRIIIFAAIQIAICLRLSVSFSTVPIPTTKNITEKSSQNLLMNNQQQQQQHQPQHHQPQHHHRQSHRILSTEKVPYEWWIDGRISGQDVRLPSLAPYSSHPVDPDNNNQRIQSTKNMVNVIAQNDDHHHNDQTIPVNDQDWLRRADGRFQKKIFGSSAAKTTSTTTATSTSTITSTSTTKTVTSQPEKFRSKRHARDISSKENTRDTVHSELEMEMKILKLYNHCSKGYVSIGNDDPATKQHQSQVNANWRRRKSSEHTQQVVYMASHYGGFGIYFYKQNKFLCIDPNTTQVVTKDCFDWCLCSFKEEVQSDFTILSWTSKPDWVLSFNNRGDFIRTSSAQYMRKKFRKCRYFTKLPGQYHNLEEEETPRLMSLKESTCDWKKTGEQIFDKEIQAHPKYDCILSPYPQMYQDLNNNHNMEPVAPRQRPQRQPSTGTSSTSTSTTTTSNKVRCVPESKIINGSKIRHRSRKARQHLC